MLKNSQQIEYAGVIGDPIAHSLSPNIHNYLQRKLNRQEIYGRERVEKYTLKSWIYKTTWAGISVTMPLKEEAYALATWHDKWSEITSVSNTLVKSNNSWKAYNTDVLGLSAAIKQQVQERTAPTVQILGSGATAVSAIYSCAIWGAKTVIIKARNEEKSSKLLIHANNAGLNFSYEKLESKFYDEGLIINTLPHNIAKKINTFGTSNKNVLFDLSYNPWPSELAKNFNQNRTVSGIYMLINQAIMQAEIFEENLSLDNKIASLDKTKIELVTEIFNHIND